MHKYKRDLIHAQAQYRMWKNESLDAADEQGNGIGYAVIFNGFANLLPKFKGRELSIYIYLLLRSKNWTGETSVAVTTIAEDLDVDERTVRRALQRIGDMGLIKRFKRGLNETYITCLCPYDAAWEKMTGQNCPISEDTGDLYEMTQ